MILKETEKEVIKLVYEKKSTREIYNITGLAPGTINNILYYLRRFYPSKNRFDLACKLMNKIKLEEDTESKNESQQN